MHQIKLQNNCIASMTIIPIHGVTKTAMKNKVEEILFNEAGISRIEETRMIEQKGNWFVVRNKAFKQQVKRRVEQILRETTLQIMYPTHTQPGTIPKEHRNPTLVSCVAVLQKDVDNGPEITNVVTLHQNERHYIVCFNALDNKSYPKLPQKK